MFYVPIIVSIFAIIFALFLIKEINKSPSGSKEMTHISQAIREEAMVFLKREYVVIAIFSVFLFFILFALLGFKVVLGFLIGALFSGLIGLLGIVISTKTNLKVAQASKQDICYALGISFKGGLAIAFLAAGIGLFSVSGVYLLTKNIQALIALGFGCSLVSIFTCLGGVIYAKSADIGAGLAGEQKKDIQKRNPKNSVVILDLIRDNIGNCASVITDLFGTYVVIMVATMALGNLIFPGQAIAILIPIYLAACALLSSIIASFFTRIKNRSKNIISIFYKGILITGVLTAFSFFWVLKAGTFFLNLSFVNFYLSFLTGLIVASGLFLITGYYSSEKHCPVFSIARASKTEHTINIIDGLSTGIQSIGLRIILVFTGIFFSFWLGGIYGISICVVSTLFLILLVIAINSYGLITGNASGIVEMS
ncbi:MAG: sodium/proton-translocating pyrophosphatase, partial [Patescibacteria group bacterium]|nr:sodium/proton-translocating pyrophosphatase [Patescibacteria group bacterium]